MSRIGKKPVPVPKGVTVNLDGSKISVKGPRGELSRSLPAVRGSGKIPIAMGCRKRRLALHGCMQKSLEVCMLMPGDT